MEQIYSDAGYAFAHMVNVMREPRTARAMRMSAADRVLKRVLGTPNLARPANASVNMNTYSSSHMNARLDHAFPRVSRGMARKMKWFAVAEYVTVKADQTRRSDLARVAGIVRMFERRFGAGVPVYELMHAAEGYKIVYGYSANGDDDIVRIVRSDTSTIIEAGEYVTIYMPEYQGIFDLPQVITADGRTCRVYPDDLKPVSL